MHRTVRYSILALPLLCLGACASEPLKAPVCDGRNRRQVNLTPSVLVGTETVPSPTAVAPPPSPFYKGC